MLTIMCEERGIDFYVPEKGSWVITANDRLSWPSYVQIGYRTSIAESKVNPNFRPDEAEVNGP